MFCRRIVINRHPFLSHKFSDVHFTELSVALGINQDKALTEKKKAQHINSLIQFKKPSVLMLTPNEDIVPGVIYQT